MRPPCYYLLEEIVILGVIYGSLVWMVCNPAAPAGPRGIPGLSAVCATCAVRCVFGLCVWVALRGVWRVARGVWRVAVSRHGTSQTPVFKRVDDHRSKHRTQWVVQVLQRMETVGLPKSRYLDEASPFITQNHHHDLGKIVNRSRLQNEACSWLVLVLQSLHAVPQTRDSECFITRNHHYGSGKMYL